MPQLAARMCRIENKHKFEHFFRVSAGFKNLSWVVAQCTCSPVYIELFRSTNKKSQTSKLTLTKIFCDKILNLKIYTREITYAFFIF